MKVNKLWYLEKTTLIKINNNLEYTKIKLLYKLNFSMQ